MQENFNVLHVYVFILKDTQRYLDELYCKLLCQAHANLGNAAREACIEQSDFTAFPNM